MENTVKKKKKKKNIFTSSKLSKSEISGVSILGRESYQSYLSLTWFPKVNAWGEKKKKKKEKMWRLSLCHTMKAFNCKRFKQTFIWSCHILLIKLVTHNSGLKLFTFTLILTPKSATTSLRSWMLCGSCTSPKQADANKTKSHAFFFF